MICGLEIAMLVWGIIVLITGKLKVNKTKEVRGLAARGLGVIMILPLPLAFAAGFTIGFLSPDTVRNSPLMLSGMEALIVLACAAVAIGAGFMLGKPPISDSTHAFPVDPTNQPPQGPA